MQEIVSKEKGDKEMKDNTAKFAAFNGIGIALFVALTMCLQVPVFENYYLCLGYVVMMVYCYRYGAASGALVGSLGVILYCLVTSGLRGMPGWTLGNIAIGLVCGMVFIRAKEIRSPWRRRALMAVTIVVMTAIGILGIKSLTECVLYGQPMAVRMAKNIYAFVADVVMMIVSIPVCEVLDKRHDETGTVRKSTEEA